VFEMASIGEKCFHCSLQGVEVDSLTSWLDFLTTQPRSAQLLSEKSNSLVISLKDAMSRYFTEHICKSSSYSLSV